MCVFMIGNIARPRFFIGVDLGQRQDHSAIAVVEKIEKKGARDPATYGHKLETELRVKALERIPLGTPYPDVVAMVKKVVKSPEIAGECLVAVDATGVGGPVVELMRRAGLGCQIRAVIVTGGYKVTRDGGWWSVPKRELIGGLQMRLESQKLKLPAGLRWGPALVEELEQMQVRVKKSGYEEFGAPEREGVHDDLVFALSLGNWAAGNIEGEKWWESRPGDRQQRLF